MKFTAKDVRGLIAPGKYLDGRGLILHVIGPARRQWVLRYSLGGRERYMGLGSAEDVSLDAARDRAAKARQLIADGIDPIDQRRATKEAEAAKQTGRITFTEVAAAYIAAHEAGWRNDKHKQQWKNTLATYAEPIIGRTAVPDITTDDVLRVLQPIWSIKPETASRVRSRIEMVLDYAAARRWRDGPNPAIWRGNLKRLLPAKTKVRPVEHHAALDWREASAFWGKLGERDGMGVRALKFAILTASRSGEVRGARWQEIDLNTGVWTIPAARMKATRDHRVPLSAPALAILADLATLEDGSGLVFLGRKRGTPVSDMTLTAVLRRMGRGELTAHGFRSTFRDWAAETTSYPNHVVEQALAHTIGKVEAAYRRGDLFAQRMSLMADWAAFLARPPAEIIPLPAKAPRKALGARAARAGDRAGQGPGAA